MYSRAARPVELERTFQHPNQATKLVSPTLPHPERPTAAMAKKKISPMAGAAETDILNFL
jgi:hypothetical protein